MSVNQDRLVEDFMSLLNIPSLTRVLYHKIEELKIQHAEKLKEFQAIFEIIKPGKIVPKNQGLKFEIIYNGTDFFPSIPGCDQAYEVVPKEVFDQILEYDIEPGTIVMSHLIKIPRGRAFEVAFEKHDRNYYTGFIVEKIKSKKKETKKNDLNHHREPQTKNRDDLLKLFLQYLLNHEVYCDYILSEFMSKWKPLIDNGCIANEG